MAALGTSTPSLTMQRMSLEGNDFRPHCTSDCVFMMVSSSAPVTSVHLLTVDMGPAGSFIEPERSRTSISSAGRCWSLKVCRPQFLSSGLGPAPVPPLPPLAGGVSRTLPGAMPLPPPPDLPPPLALSPLAVMAGLEQARARVRTAKALHFIGGYLFGEQEGARRVGAPARHGPSVRSPRFAVQLTWW